VPRSASATIPSGKATLVIVYGSHFPKDATIILGSEFDVLMDREKSDENRLVATVTPHETAAPGPRHISIASSDGSTTVQPQVQLIVESPAKKAPKPK
jgi:hypothetical protein